MSLPSVPSREVSWGFLHGLSGYLREEFRVVSALPL